MIYTSHFLEHIPVRIAEDVLRNCFEILGKKGLIRIVVPDLENICREYVKQIEKGDFEKSRFLTIELLDQLVRQTSGGLLLEQYGLASHNEELRRYISRRNGHEFRFVKERTKTKSRTKRLLRNPTLMMLHAKKLYINSILSFLPKNYRLQEISRAPFGERHHWVYDFAFLKNQLEKVGFTSVTRVSAQFSNRSDFPCFPLDIDEIGRIRKGEESMFIEAFKR
jgi:predicted SAM-dependent methyltransferase